ncbi:DUF2336 domain-containing protein [Bifidobacterium sp. SO1]|uniref:DUF2336 domain-containing protein n=1 Tax=Bifidobacterium sp. SO1 TaxID=2809029 RepID=UPI001BDBC3C6|nr:DUF2336 domain-containing protein [Bifidobacterium sp. SO1]MBT1162739.1 hypothetical protein [Bifidobacterium sp. SO1]
MNWRRQAGMLAEGSLPTTDAAYDPNPVIRMLAARRDLPSRIIRRLARDPSPAVRATIAMRPDLDQRTVEDLAWDSNADVRLAVARRNDLNDHVRGRLSEDHDPRVLDALGDHDAAGLLRSAPAPLDEPQRRGFPW